MTSRARTVASPQTRKLLLAVHLGFIGSWMGATVAMTFLSVLGLSTDNAELRRGAYMLMSRMDTGLIVPLVIASVLSGVVLALRTPWGLLRHRWVIAKIAVTAMMIAFATSTVMPWVQELAAGARAELMTPALARRATLLTGAAVTFLAGLWTLVFLAVYKPWGRRSTAPVEAPRP